MIPGTEIQQRFVRPLLRWSRRSPRPLPWRDGQNPYHIWISEILSQQTQAERAGEYFLRFIDRFPTVQDLASARWREVYAVWRGAGYYQRARNIMKAAKVIVSKYDGTIPQDTGALEALPGVGRYTAAAIQSFAFRENVPAIDTNFNRVFQRFFGCPENDVAARAEGLYAGLRSTGPDLNQAIMDLGAMVCKSRNPGCASCPLASSCDFFQNNRMEGSEPARRKVRRSPRTVIDVGIACIHRDGKYLVGRCLRSKGGKWEFPGGKRNRGEDIRSCLKREVKEELGVEVSVRPPFLTVERPDRSYIFRLHFCRCKLQRGRVKALEYEELAWLTPREISQIPFPRANAKAVQRLQKMKN